MNSSTDRIWPHEQSQDPAISPAHGAQWPNEEGLQLLDQLSEHVSEIAERLAQLKSLQSSADVTESAADSPKDEASTRIVRHSRPPLPDPRLVRQIIRQRQLRMRFFDADLFSDPAWDILLDLTAARAEYTRVTVTSLCIASGVPPTTALRWISQMVEAGLLERVEDDADHRRAFISLSDSAADAMAHYFAELGRAAALQS